MLESCETISCKNWGLDTCLIEDSLLLQGDGDSASHPRRPELSTITCLKNKLSLPLMFVIYLVKKKLFPSFVVILEFFAPEVTAVGHKTSSVFELSGGATLQTVKISTRLTLTAGNHNAIKCWWRETIKQKSRKLRGHFIVAVLYPSVWFVLILCNHNPWKHWEGLRAIGVRS